MILTLEDAQSMIGVTFERDGERRTFRRLTISEHKPGVVWTSNSGKVAWISGRTRFVRCSLDEWNRWVYGARKA